MEQDKKRKELKEALGYINKISGDITKWQEDTKNFFDKALGYDSKTIKKDEILMKKIEEDKKLISDLSDRITSETITSMKRFKEGIDSFVSNYKIMEASLPEKAKTICKDVLSSYTEQFRGYGILYGASKNIITEKDCNQILTVYKEVVNHLEKAIESMGEK